jgi:hypothetical protein
MSDKHEKGGSARPPLAKDSGRALPTSRITVPMPKVNPPKPSQTPMPAKNNGNERSSRLPLTAARVCFMGNTAGVTKCDSDDPPEECDPKLQVRLENR